MSGPYGDDSPEPAPFRAIRPTAPVHALDKPRERAPRRVARPGGPAATIVRTTVERTHVSHAAPTLRLDTPPDRELAIRAVHALGIVATAARAALEDHDPEAAEAYLRKAADLVRVARRATRGG